MLRRSVANTQIELNVTILLIRGPASRIARDLSVGLVFSLQSRGRLHRLRGSIVYSSLVQVLQADERLNSVPGPCCHFQTRGWNFPASVWLLRVLSVVH